MIASTCVYSAIFVEVGMKSEWDDYNIAMYPLLTTAIIHFNRFFLFMKIHFYGELLR